MKYFLIIFLVGFSRFSQAQEKVVKHLSSKQQAEHIIQEIQSMLHLSDVQRDSMYSIFLIEASLGDSVRTNQNKNPHKIQQFKNTARQNHLRIDTILDIEQRKLYYQWQKEHFKRIKK